MKDYTAVGIHIFCKRDEAVKERNGLLVPDAAQKKPNMGEIISVGKQVGDKSIQTGRKAIWNRHVGMDIEIDDQVITVLRDVEILGVL